MSIENNNEITVKVKSSFKDVIEILEKNNFEIIDKFYLDDSYFINESLDIRNITIRQILENAVIVRDVGRCKLLVFKKKEIDENGNILKQEKIECEIQSIDDAKSFLNAIGYKQLMEIIEDDICYSKDGLGLVLKNVRGGDNLIEVETTDKKGLNTIEDLKEKILKLNLPIDESNFFVKKAEIELEKILNKT